MPDAAKRELSDEDLAELRERVERERDFHAEVGIEAHRCEAGLSVVEALRLIDEAVARGKPKR